MVERKAKSATALRLRGEADANGKAERRRCKTRQQQEGEETCVTHSTVIHSVCGSISRGRWKESPFMFHVLVSVSSSLSQLRTASSHCLTHPDNNLCSINVERERSKQRNVRTK